VRAEQLLDWVVASCESQGLALHVMDSAALDQVAALLAGEPAARRAQARSASTAAGVHRSDAPDWDYALDL